MRTAQGTHAQVPPCKAPRILQRTMRWGTEYMNDIASEFERVLGHAALKLGPTRSHSFIDQSPRIRYRSIR